MKIGLKKVVQKLGIVLWFDIVWNHFKSNYKENFYNVWFEIIFKYQNYSLGHGIVCLLYNMCILTVGTQSFGKS